MCQTWYGNQLKFISIWRNLHEWVHRTYIRGFNTIVCLFFCLPACLSSCLSICRSVCLAAFPKLKNVYTDKRLRTRYDNRSEAYLPILATCPAKAKYLRCMIWSYGTHLNFLAKDLRILAACLQYSLTHSGTALCLGRNHFCFISGPAIRHRNIRARVPNERSATIAHGHCGGLLEAHRSWWAKGQWNRGFDISETLKSALARITCCRKTKNL